MLPTADFYFCSTSPTRNCQKAKIVHVLDKSFHFYPLIQTFSFGGPPLFTFLDSLSNNIFEISFCVLMWFSNLTFPPASGHTTWNPQKSGWQSWMARSVAHVSSCQKPSLDIRRTKFLIFYGRDLFLYLPQPERSYSSAILT